MIKIRKLAENELEDYARIVQRSFPGFKIQELENYVNILKDMQKNNPTASIYGCFKNDQLVAGERLHDFSVNIFNKIIPAGGVGMVAVDLLNKKQKLCRDMIRYFQEHYTRQGTSLAMLYPFRPDFYREMGFGLGMPLHQYRLKPEELPRSRKELKLTYLNSDDLPQILDFYHEYFTNNHGMIDKNESDFKRFFNSANYQIIGSKNNGKINGYMIFSFKQPHQNNIIINDLTILELLYEDEAVFLEFCSFLNSQSDQINRIIWNTFDQHLHFLPGDLRNDSDNLFPPVYHESFSGGIGLMYKLINPEKFFLAMKDHHFGRESINILFRYDDSLMDKFDQELIVGFRSGSPITAKKLKPDVEIKLDISELSSLILGLLPVRKGILYDLISISDKSKIDMIDNMFSYPKHPECNIWF